MFTVTPEETQAIAAANARIDEIRQEKREKSDKLRGLPRLYGASEEERAAQQTLIQGINAEIAALDEEARALQQSDTVLTVALKTQLNQTLSQFMPSGSPTAYLTIAEQAVASLQGESAQRARALVKTVILTGFEALMDEDVAAARARITYLRYSSLVDAGFTSKVATDIVVAEASRPISFPSASRSK